MTESATRIVVLGAGPAGLGAAFAVSRNGKARVTVIERNEVVGGNAGSFEFGNQRVDFGSHRLHPSCDPEILADIRRLLGNDLLRRPRHGRIRLKGRWIHFPPQPLDLLLRLDKSFALAMAKDMLFGDAGHEDDESFASVIRSQLGATISDHFYLPYATKIWGIEPHRISPVQARRRVSAGSFSRLLRKVFGTLPGVKPLGFNFFYYPRWGFGQICEAYAKAVVEAGVDLVLSESVVRLRAPRSKSEPWAVFSDKRGAHKSFEADMVWSTLPISVLARLIEPKAPANVLAATQSIRYRSMILVYIQLETTQLTEYDAHYFPGSEFRITRLSETKNYTGSRDPSGSTVLCAELPCSPDEELWQLSSDALASVVVSDLERAGLSIRKPPQQVEIRRLPQAYPVYEVGFEEPLECLDTWLGAQPGLLTFGRQGLFVHDNTHHALYMAYCAAECLKDGKWDSEKWAQYRLEFETHVVED